MRRDSRVCSSIGEDVAEAGTPFKFFRPGRRIWCEACGRHANLRSWIHRVAVGAAMTGLRPVVDIMFGDFITLTMDQMVNQAAKAHYMSGGHWKVPW